MVSGSWSSRWTILVGWGTALLMIVAIAGELLRRAVQSWLVLALLACCCAGIGAAVWDGAQPLSFAALRDEIGRAANPESAIVDSLNEILKTETVLRQRAQDDNPEGRSARRALYLIENGARR